MGTGRERERERGRRERPSALVMVTVPELVWRGVVVMSRMNGQFCGQSGRTKASKLPEYESWSTPGSMSSWMRDVWLLRWVCFSEKQLKRERLASVSRAGRLQRLASMSRLTRLPFRDMAMISTDTPCQWYDSLIATTDSVNPVNPRWTLEIHLHSFSLITCSTH